MTKDVAEASRINFEDPQVGLAIFTHYSHFYMIKTMIGHSYGNFVIAT